MRRKMWMGTRGNEMWVPAASISNADFSKVGYSTATKLLNGGTTVRNSKASAKRYTMSWNLANRDDVRPITDMYDGLYDNADGVNLIYFLDPMAKDKNLAPQGCWGFPAQSAEDGMPLFPDQRPTAVATGANSLGLPVRSALYKANAVSEKLYIPIPPGYAAWVGFYGSATGSAGLRVTPAIGVSGAGSPTTLTPLALTDNSRCNTSFSSASGYTGIDLDAIVTGLLRNLATNPSFENDLTGVLAIPGTTGVAALSRPSGTAKVGNYVSRVTWTTATTAAGGGQSTDVPGISAGKVYSFGVFARASIVTRLKMTLGWYKADGTLISSGTVSAEAVTTASPAWSSAGRFISENNLAPTGAVTARLSIISTAGTSFANWSIGSWLEIDAVQANVGTTVQGYTDGNTSGWYWIGAVNASVSAQTANTITLTGVIIQVLPIGVTPSAGSYISGQGNSGCQFNGAPTQTPYSAKLDRVGVAAILEETGQWL